MTEAENNDRAVIISEEIEFFEELFTYELPPGAHTLIVERRDVLRAAMQTAEGGGAMDEPTEGFTPGVPDDMESEAYEADDDLDIEAEDEDHDYQANRNDTTCLVCGQPKAACTEEP